MKPVLVFSSKAISLALVLSFEGFCLWAFVLYFLGMLFSFLSLSSSFLSFLSSFLSFVLLLTLGWAFCYLFLSQALASLILSVYCNMQIRFPLLAFGSFIFCFETKGQFLLCIRQLLGLSTSKICEMCSHLVCLTNNNKKRSYIPQRG